MESLLPDRLLQTLASAADLSTRSRGAQEGSGEAFAALDFEVCDLPEVVFTEECPRCLGGKEARAVQRSDFTRKTDGLPFRMKLFGLAYSQEAGAQR